MSTSGSYRRVAHNEGPNLQSSDSFISTGTAAPGLSRPRVERLTDKLVALGWIIFALLVARWTNFYSTIWSGDKPNRGLLHLAFFGLSAIMALVLYLTVYLPKFKGLSDSSAWGVYCPRVIPAMAGIAVVTVLIFLRAIWPVWSFLGPLLFGIELMGALMSLHFIPVPTSIR